MRFDRFLEPISADDPCGPDLLLDDDDGYIEYYFEAIDRVPMRYILNSDTGETFDRRSIDWKAEWAQIEPLLERSRDIRLLVLDAKFQILCGRIIPFTEAVIAIATLLEAQWQAVIPLIEEGDPTERKNQLELLDDRSSVVMPLQHAPLIRDRRLDQITYRDYLVASGQAEPRANETPRDASALTAALQSAENAEQVDALHAALSAARQAVEQIGLMCRSADGGPFAPQLDTLTEVLEQMTGFLAAARPDLSGAAAAEDSAEGDALGGAPDSPDTPATAMPAAPPRPVGAVSSQTGAKAALLAVETYYAHHEPSSPALLLIRQARLLIGRPLTEAIDTLLPDVSEHARIDFGTETGFRMSVHKMRMLADEAGDIPPADDAEEDSPDFAAATRTEAGTLIAAVEAFFRQTEPSSPVPILLFKAKTYLNRDFSAIIGDLFGHIE
ncbi:hypothetical protein ATO2_08730 [Roseovarius sp. 22II1-1F6A]|nr:hypothetical protein ATO2_08730 [Roseovarius sp. 22II1-1F6A]